ncbi:MAG: insulinase family protein [Planctomycetes bacterium]|nr:insulinase family protein [Planctomycetota bacterium]
MTQNVVNHATLPNGLTVLVETMPAVQSAAFALLVSAGSVYDPPQQNGTATALADWMARGAGDRSSRELLAELDRLGIQGNETASTQHLVFRGSCLSVNLGAALRVYSDIVLQPHLNEEEFEAVMSGVELGLMAIEDEPRQKVMVELLRRCYPHPWGQPSEGTLADLENLTPDSVRTHYQRVVKPNGAILGIAGNVTLNDVLPVVSDVFGAWTGSNDLTIPALTCSPVREHLALESTQTQIGVAYPSVAYSDPEYYAAWAAVNVLSGGMSSRLFTEIREKRGLCYSVYATLNTLKDRGQVLCYAGTTAERAQETLDVLRAELMRLGDGIGQDELDRCKARAKSSLIMAQESSGSRSASLARNWYHLGRIVTLDEVRSKIDALTVATVLDYVHAHPARDFSILTIGPAALQ